MNSGHKSIKHLMAHVPTLRWRIVVILLLVSILPLALVGIGSWNVFGRLLRAKTLEHMHSLVQGHARSIESHLIERVRLLRLMAETLSLREITLDNRLSGLLEELNLLSDDGFVDLGVIDAEGNHLAYLGPYDLHGRNYRDADWFREVMIRRVYVSDVFLGFRQVPHCVIAVKIGEGWQGWILRATINSAKLDNLVRTGILGQTGDAYIINRKGLYQTTPRNGNVLDSALISRPEIHTGLRDTLVTISGKKKIRASAWLNDNHWMLVVEQDEAEVRAPVNQAIASGAIVVLLAMILLVVTTFLATRHLTGKIDEANARREEITRAFMRSAKLASIGELGTGLAHEINNPLAVISAEQTNIADIIANYENEQNPAEQIMESVDRCRRQVKRCASITTKMLQFGRKRETTLEPTDLEARLKDITALLHRQAGIRNIQIVHEIEPDLPNVLVDPVELEQVIVNLINNSFEALEKGGQIWLKAFCQDGAVHLIVQDNGCGMDVATLERIFEPFFTSKPIGKGTGLGLSVCYGIVHSWGGRIEAESELGKGTSIHIHLPLPYSENIAKPVRKR